MCIPVTSHPHHFILDHEAAAPQNRFLCLFRGSKEGQPLNREAELLNAGKSPLSATREKVQKAATVLNNSDGSKETECCKEEETPMKSVLKLKDKMNLLGKSWLHFTIRIRFNRGECIVSDD